MKSTLTALAITLSMFAITDANAQEETGQIEIQAMAIQDEGGTLGGAPLIIQATEDLGNGSRSSMRIMSADGPMAMSFMGDNGAFFSMGGPMSGGDDFSMLQNASVQKDLELVDDQMKMIRDIQKQFGQKIKESIGDISKGGFDPARAKDLTTVIKKLKEEQKEQINKILLPHQQDRLKQVGLQMQMQNRGTAGALSSDRVAEALGITDEQKANLKKREQELKKELEEKIAEFKEEMKASLMKELNAKQRAQLKEMMGDKFKAEASDWRKQMQERMQRRSSRSSDSSFNSSSDSSFNSSSDSDSSSSRSSGRRVRRSGGGN